MRVNLSLTLTPYNNERNCRLFISHSRVDVDEVNRQSAAASATNCNNENNEITVVFYLLQTINIGLNIYS